MGPKRKFSDLEGVHPSRQAQVPGFLYPPPTGPRSQAFAHHRKRAKMNTTTNTPGVNFLKKSIRNKKRRLERLDDLPATIRVEDERALTAYEQELAEVEEVKTRRKMIKRYHMVRFFERQKATRALKRIRKQLLEPVSTEEAEKICGEIHIAEVDLNYTQFYPLIEPYVAIFAQKVPGDNTSAAQEVDTKVASKRPAMWAKVEKAMAEGTLEQLRNGSTFRVDGKMLMMDVLTSRPKPKPASARVRTPSQGKDDSSGRDKSRVRSKKPPTDTTMRQDVDRIDTNDGIGDGGFFED